MQTLSANPVTASYTVWLPTRRMLGITALFIVGYVLIGWASRSYLIRPFGITPWNPSAGFALAMLLMFSVGPGVSPAIFDRLFEPFATTKPTGIGLGLAMSRSMIESHDGKLWIERGAGGGTVFNFSLPLADTESASYDPC